MKRLTIKAVNKAIAHTNLELIAGEGYYYFVGDGSEHADCASVYVYRLNHQELADWVSNAETVRANITAKQTLLAL